MGYIQVTKDDGQVKAWLDGVIREITPRSVQLIDDIANEYKGAMMEEAPWQWGELSRSHVVDATGPLSRLIYSDVPYFPYVVLGTAPHEINSPIFIKDVGWRFIKDHPGTSPSDYIDRAFDMAQPAVENEIQSFLDWVSE